MVEAFFDSRGLRRNTSEYLRPPSSHNLYTGDLYRTSYSGVSCASESFVVDWWCQEAHTICPKVSPSFTTGSPSISWAGALTFWSGMGSSSRALCSACAQRDAGPESDQRQRMVYWSQPLRALSAARGTRSFGVSIALRCKAQV